MISSFRPNNQRGITLVELSITIGIVAILLSTIFTVLISMQKTYNLTARKLDNTTEKTLGERFIWLNSVNAGPSFNNLNSLDDAGLFFWDLWSDYPGKRLGGVSSRTKTLDVAGESLELLLFDRQADPPVYYDPVMAYDVVLGANADTLGTMTFMGLNYNNYLDALNPAIYLDGKMVMIYSPIALRPLGVPPNAIPPRFSIFTGTVTGAALGADNGGGIIRNTQPVTGAVNGTADGFFRNAPQVGAATQMVFVAGVELIRFIIQARAGGGFNLVRNTWVNGVWAKPFLVAANINSAVFTRSSVSVATIDGLINFNF